MVFQGDSRMFAKQVWSEIVRPNHSTQLRDFTMWTDNWAICIRRRIGTLCSNGDGELHKIGAWACLHVDSITCRPFCPFQNDLTKGCRLKTQPTWFGEAVDWGVMKYMSTNMLYNALSEWRIEIYDGSTIWTCQANVIDKARVWISMMLQQKTGLPW